MPNQPQPPAVPIVRMICVYGHRESLSGPGQCLLADDTAREMVDSGLAKWVNRCKAIQLLREGALKVRDLSAQMGPRVTEAAVMGSYYHWQLVEAWQ